MAERIVQRYRALLAHGELAPDAAQQAAVARLQALEAELREYKPLGLFGKANEPPKGLYLWGDVGRGKSMLMDLFFARVPSRTKRRVHFNAFMVETHARIHEARRHGADDPIATVAKRIAEEAVLLCFDEFCRQPLAAADYVEIARHFHTLLIDGVPVLSAGERNEARRFTLLIDTLYDEHVKLVCSAAASPESLYPAGDGADAFRRTIS